MLELNSKNYNAVSVTLRGQENPLNLSVQKGLALMDYLANENKSSHVKLTDSDGSVVLVKTVDILRVEPMMKMKNVEDLI